MSRDHGAAGSAGKAEVCRVKKNCNVRIKSTQACSIPQAQVSAGPYLAPNLTPTLGNKGDPWPRLAGPSPPHTLLPTGSGFVMCSGKENPDSDADLDVDGDDTLEYGKPQYPWGTVGQGGTGGTDQRE